MFSDLSPYPTGHPDVLVLGEGELAAGLDIEDVMEHAHMADAIDDNGTIYIVLQREPRRVWDFTERTLEIFLRKEKQVPA